eukprot:843018-Prorocentrum_minimum.AAC.1
MRQHPRNPWDADRRPASSACSRSSFSSISFSLGQFLCQCFIPGQNLQGGPGLGVCPPALFLLAFAPSRVHSSMLPSLPRVLVMRGLTWSRLVIAARRSTAAVSLLKSSSSRRL